MGPLSSLYRIASRQNRAGGKIAIAIIALALGCTSIQAREKDRTLKLHFTHTGERGVFTYKRNGKYDAAVLKKLNHIMRDWRRNEPTKMDPKLFDVVWQVYQDVGGKDYIHIVSGYRSVKTNDMLRRRGRGAAKQSRHTRGQAMDFFIPGVSVSKIRKAGLRLQRGGVGYYPKSGSPFVHLDTGNVRHWPRMTRQQLASVFPKGQTLHVPSDGKPLAGYEIAKAKYGGRGETAAVAYLDTNSRSIRPANVASNDSPQKKATLGKWLKRTLGGGADEEEDNAIANPDAVMVATAETAPLPRELTESSRQIALAALETATPEMPGGVLVASAALDTPSVRPVISGLAPTDDRFSPALPGSRSQDQIKLSRLMAQAALRAEEDEPVVVAAAEIPEEIPAEKPAAQPAAFTVASGPDPVGKPEPAVRSAFAAPEPVADTKGNAIDAANAISVNAKGQKTITLETEKTVALAYAGFAEEVTRKRPDSLLVSPRVKPTAPLPIRATSEDADTAAAATETEAIIDRDLPARLLADEGQVEFARFLGDQTTRTIVFAELEMPHPWAVPGFFKAPKNVYSASRNQPGRTLRFDRFARLDNVSPRKPDGKSRLAYVRRPTTNF